VTANEIEALSGVGYAYDFFVGQVRVALRAGVSPEKIVDFLDAPERQIGDAALRRILEREVMVPGEVEEDQAAIEAEAEIETREQPTIPLDEGDTVVQEKTR
jgi:hypothetical protein